VKLPLANNQNTGTGWQIKQDRKADVYLMVQAILPSINDVLFVK
jgi:hypothetical protein